MGNGDSGCTCCPKIMAAGAGLPAGMGTLCAVGTGSSLLSGLGESASPLTSPSALAAFLLVDGGTYTEEQALQDYIMPSALCAWHKCRKSLLLWSKRRPCQRKASVWKQCC